MSILELFCSVDDFWQQFAPTWHISLLTEGQRQRLRPTQMYPSEMMTIVILFQHSHYRTFKAFYIEYVQRHLHSEFPALVSYQRFASVDADTAGATGGLSPHPLPSVITLASTSIGSRLPALLVARPPVGWFFGFKLHLVINDQGDLLAFCLTPGNVDDRHPVPKLARGLVGKLFGDKGYLSQPLAQQLLVTHGPHLITELRKKMHNRLLEWSDKLLLRKRAIIETITDQLKNSCQIEHSRHRSPINFLVNLIAGLIAYCHQPKKPSLGLQLPALTQA
jgi:Transposase DDE domain